MPARSSKSSVLPPVPSTPHIAQTSKVELCVDVDATKADSDKKSYRLIKLPNGLRALLIHDPPAASTGAGSRSTSKGGKGRKGSVHGAEGDSNEEDDEEDDDDNDDGDDMDDDDESGSEEDTDGDEEDGGEDEGRGGGSDVSEGVKKAAAAMAVGVGNLSDPEHCQGLAHYLEHMLFMGSTKYPDENEYDSFLSQRGGSCNAFTECECTLYHFDVLPEHLEKALDIFAQFFVSPLMKADSSDRELQSIESEFCLSKNNDACRLQELWCHTSKRDHPYSRFCWGNLWSLKDMPRSKGVDVRRELVDFHARHYRAPAMQLVVLGGHSLDELQRMAVDCFSAVAEGATEEEEEGGEGEKGEAAAVAAAGLPFEEGSLGRAFRIQPVKDVHRLQVTWQLGEQLSLYKSKPCEYLGHLIGHEGEGSVLSLLRDRRWATGVCAGVYDSGHNNSSCCATFSVTFYLTKAGVRNWLDVAGVLFRYLGMLDRKGPQEWVFREIRDVANIQYRFQEDSEPAEYVEELAQQMLPARRFEDMYILKGPYVMEDWNAELIEGILRQLSPSAARYDVQSSLFGRAVDGASSPEGENTGKRGKKRPAADSEGGQEEAEEGAEDSQEEGSDEEGSEEDSEEGPQEDSEQEEEEEEGGEARFHDLCKKPDAAPLQEPRMGLCYWSDPIPAEILKRWAASRRCMEEEDGNRDRALSSCSQTSQSIKEDAAEKNADEDGAPAKESSLLLLPTLTLPKPNPFIPSEFVIKEAAPWCAGSGEGNNGHTNGYHNKDDDGDAGVRGGTEAAAARAGGGEVEGVLGAPKPCPRRVVREDRDEAASSTAVTMWHLQDRSFCQPRAEMFLKVVTAVSYESARSAALSELVVRLVNDSLTEYSYAAYVAELQYSLEATSMGFQIHVYGFDHKAHLMLREVLKRLLDLKPHLKEGPLSVQLEALLRGFRNTDMKPSKHASNARLQALRKGRWSPEQKQDALTGGGGGRGGGMGEGQASQKAVSMEDVVVFLERLFQSVELEGLVHGNFSEDDAITVLDDIQKVADEAARSRRRQQEDDGVGFKYPEEPVVRLNASQHVLYCCPSKDPTEQNCALELYWQIGVNRLHQRVLADAIEQVMHEPFFDQLRTKEQLGYSVGCSTRVTWGVLGFCVTVQSAAYGPAYLYSRVRAFMVSFRETLADMTEGAFSTHMASAAANKLQPDNTLSEEAQRHWPEIYSRRRAFHVQVEEARMMRGLEKSAVVGAYEEWFSTAGAASVGKPCLTIAVTGTGKFDAEDEAASLAAKIKDEEPEDGSRTLVRIATPPEAYAPSEGRDVFDKCLVEGVM